MSIDNERVTQADERVCKRLDRQSLGLIHLYASQVSIMKGPAPVYLPL